MRAVWLLLLAFDPSGTKMRFLLAGWQPAGDEAFDLVRDDANVYLAVLEATSLSFLRLCAG